MEFSKFTEDTGSSSSKSVDFNKRSSRNTRLFYGFLIAALIGIIIGLAVGIPLSTESSDDSSTTPMTYLQKAKAIMSVTPLIDGHSDLPWQYRQYAKNKVYNVSLLLDTRVQWSVDVPMDNTKYPRIPPQTDIPRLVAGKVGAQFWAIFCDCGSTGKDAVRIGFDQLDVIRKFTDKYDIFQLATTAQGILDAFNAGKIASLIGLEGGHMIGNTLSVLRAHYDLGARYMTLTHSCDTSWADNWKQDNNATGSRRGLSDFGKIVVREMNRLGMMIDLSHVSYNTMLDALDVSEAPVIFSHSSAYAECNHNRNVRDDVLMKVKENGGLVMVNFYDYYISRECPPKNANLSSMQDVIDHINYIKNKIGIDYVGIGADYDGVPTMPEELEDVSTYPALFAKMLEQGWTEADMKKLIGENLLRVFRRVEEVKSNKANMHPYEDIIVADERIPDNSCYTGF